MYVQYMHYALIMCSHIYDIYFHIVHTVPIIKKLTRPSVLARSSMCGRPTKRPCHRRGRSHSTDNEYD